MTRWSQQLSVVAALAGLDPGMLGLALAAATASPRFRYLSLMVLLDVPVSFDSGPAFLRGTYAKLLLPGGVAPLLTAYSMRRTTSVSVDRGLAGTLVAFTGMGLALAAVVAFSHRLRTYWFVLLLGGGATALLPTRSN
ncbi:hypothetical protein BRC89_01730 [Halobacteriales archaeon QS_4_70_19]|nr:MAG: hypothetical protein BRC89_01730 [Halobacteriales archaeon QS_4_70_19]